MGRQVPWWKSTLGEWGWATLGVVSVLVNSGFWLKCCRRYVNAHWTKQKLVEMEGCYLLL